MIAALLAAIVLDPTPAAPPPSQASQTATVLRELVYKFSYDNIEERTIEDFGVPPQSQMNRTGYSGTMTLDVMKVGQDGSILMAIAEMTNAENQKKPSIAQIVVHPDGSLIETSGAPDQNMLILLPYFATSYFGDRTLQEGTTWQTSATNDKMVSSTAFNVSKVDGDVATVTAVQTQKGGSLTGSLTTRTTVAYKASLLVPISLNVQVSNDRTGMAATQTSRAIFNFERTSDTRDTTAKGN
jgi:hypothetical protein